MYITQNYIKTNGTKPKENPLQKRFDPPTRVRTHADQLDTCPNESHPSFSGFRTATRRLSVDGEVGSGTKTNQTSH